MCLVLLNEFQLEENNFNKILNDTKFFKYCFERTYEGQVFEDVCIFLCLITYQKIEAFYFKKVRLKLCTVEIFFFVHEHVFVDKKTVLW